MQSSQLGHPSTWGTTAEATALRSGFPQGTPTGSGPEATAPLQPHGQRGESVRYPGPFQKLPVPSMWQAVTECLGSWASRIFVVPLVPSMPS